MNHDRLPTPTRSRWQPLRIGLVDIFYYDREEFWFRDGRLLLRGNNGTGKSKVLALTLPFLLDGDLRAHRVEPDGDPKKRMEWNLLLGGEHPHPERLGYTWIEFGRLDEAGEPHFRTLACGLKAVAGRGIARHWYAVTEQRVGRPEDGHLSLLDATGAALGRDRLAEAVAGHGMVYDQAKAYRRAVDEALFGLGEQRYGALVDLLVQLRQPQLSKRPDERALSRALTEALPPMDQRIVADAAEAFRSLDDEKAGLAAMDEARRAATGFLEHYRRYARAACRRKAVAPRERHSRYEAVHRELGEAREEHRSAGERLAAADQALTELGGRAVRLEAEEEALRARPEMRSAQELDRAAREAERTEAASRTARADHDGAAEQLARARGRLDTTGNRLAAARERLGQALAESQEAAAEAGIGPGHGERVAGPARAGEQRDVAALRRAAAGLADGRSRAVDHLEGLVGAAEEAEAGHRAARARLEAAAADTEEAAQGQEEAARRVAEATDALVAAVRERLDVAVELRPPDTVGLLDRLQQWAGPLDGPYPVRAEAEAAHRRAAEEFVTARAALESEGETLRRRSAELRDELARLESGGQRSPRPPHTRSAEAREHVPGAPLWRLVDFGDQLTDSRRAGLEAALEASGLLDAWVSPDGTALRAGTHDVLLTGGEPVTAGPSLARVLRPAVDAGDENAAAVGAEAVRRLLDTIAFGEDAEAAHTWVDDAGRFRVGALSGSWAKPAAEYLGAGAREAARRARIADLRGELTALDGELEHVAQRLTALEERRTVLDDELAALPDDTELRRAHALAGAAADALNRARERQDHHARRCAEAAERERQARDTRDATAAGLRLPPDREALRTVRGALAAYREALAGLWPALREHTDAEQAVAADREEAERAARRAEELAVRAEEAGREAAAAGQRHLTLQSTVGTAVAELQRKLGEVARARTACAEERREATRRREEALRAESRAQGRTEQLAADVEDAVRQRAEAIEALRRFAATGLLSVALPDLVPPPGIPAADLAGTGPEEVPAEQPGQDGDWSPTAGVELARSIERELSGTDLADTAWERVQRRVNDEFKGLQDALARHGHSASAQVREDGIVVEVVFQGHRRAVPELATALETEVDQMQRILSAREREILETHLLTEVGGTLQELIGAAERQVLEMNEELQERPTSTGMRLRLVWRPSRQAPSGLGPARERLRRSADAWSPGDRAAIGEFLQAQIGRAQADDPSGSWLEHLTRALDYRDWHEFSIERRQHGRWRSATGPASGGERVLSVSVPLFAAASSHYRTAGNPHAPRLVTLDEAFAGVDDDARASCLGLLSTFDLDVVMTSEREWACYPEVPGVAIAQLSRVDEVPAVLVTRWEWDGRRRAAGPEPRPVPLPAQAR
ncbi:hypothetical protein GCM10009716_07880 [Streptomyces sodiiphilus]|uniref:TIGR02680 family protein n=1 Tax=Streptomyces sodiiphilus TaxID=226217 RepID=A0ABN2NS45_9ACTN